MCFMVEIDGQRIEMNAKGVSIETRLRKQIVVGRNTGLKRGDKDHRYRWRNKECKREKDAEDSGKEREKATAKEKSKDREKDRDMHTDNEKERDTLNTPGREKGKDRIREERDTDQKEWSSEKEKASYNQQQKGHLRSNDVGKDVTSKLDGKDSHYRDVTDQEIGFHHDNDGHGTLKHEQNEQGEPIGTHRLAAELEEHISKMKEERLKIKCECEGSFRGFIMG